MKDRQHIVGDKVESPQCQFFVVRKKRLCRMTVRPDREYCGEHEPQPEPGEEVDKRIPCPNDPKHTCYMSKLEKHLAKCNARKGTEPPYIEHNVNAPEWPGTSPRIPLKDVPEDFINIVIEKIDQLYDLHIKGTILTMEPEQAHHTCIQADINQADRAESSRRHLKQVSRIMQLTEQAGLVHDCTCYVEMGAGKGMLSYYLSEAWCSNNSRVLVIERASLRHKRDNRTSRATRLRADLAHLLLSRVGEVEHSVAVLALAKHLCGVATDYALRCVTADSIVKKARGVVMATCCHHRCDLAGYVATKHMQDLGISNEELNIIFSIVSWATCGDGRSRDTRRQDHQQHILSHDDCDNEQFDQENFDVEDKPSFLISKREDVGRRAKALLDYGRILYLRDKGFEASMCYYVPTTESLENVCIVAKKNVL